MGSIEKRTRQLVGQVSRVSTSVAGSRREEGPARASGGEADTDRQVAAVASDTPAPARYNTPQHVPIIIVGRQRFVAGADDGKIVGGDVARANDCYIIAAVGRGGLELPRIITISLAEISENTPLAFGSTALRPKRFFSEANSAGGRAADASRLLCLLCLFAAVLPIGAARCPLSRYGAELRPRC